jgi:hypothetical protein
MFYLHHLFRSLAPVHNPIGFGGVDLVELFAALALVALALAWKQKETLLRLAPHTGWSMAILFALPVALRLALLPVHPVPMPAVADDFSYLLLADTLSHGRLANPVHPMHRFFETFFVLQEPSYSSVYPPGQGIALALGRALFGDPWAGVAISIGLFCALCYWMLRGWTSPRWALAGGFLAAMEFGPLNQWMNSYWGGAVSGIAGCLVFGALPRLRERGRMRDAALLGLGLGLQLITRPFECIFLAIAAALFLLPDARKMIRVTPVIAAALLPAVALTMLHNKRVTGEWTTLPNALSRWEYGVPAAFTTQPNALPHRELTREQQLDYQLQASVHGDAPETLRSYVARLLSRVRFYRFFFFAPLYIALAAFLWRMKERRFQWLAASAALFALGSNFYPYFYSHYIAAIACLLLLAAIAGLERMPRAAAQWILFACVAQFGLWYAAHLTGDPAMWQFETWDAINYGDPDGRIAVNRQLAELPGKQLVFVRYAPQHTFKEWVYNAADIDASRVVWARDLGPAEDEKLRAYYPDRQAWLLQPDARPVQLVRYAAPPPEPPAAPAPNPKLPHLKFEEVH